MSFFNFQNILLDFSILKIHDFVQCAVIWSQPENMQSETLAVDWVCIFSLSPPPNKKCSLTIHIFSHYYFMASAHHRKKLTGQVIKLLLCTCNCLPFQLENGITCSLNQIWNMHSFNVYDYICWCNFTRYFRTLLFNNVLMPALTCIVFNTFHTDKLITIA